MANTLSLQNILDRPFILIIAVGLIIRLILMPLLTYDFDIYHWGLIISNIDSGNGLYELDGYYYTPVWGYILGSVSEFQQLLFDIGPMGVRFTDLLPIEELAHPYHIATITSIAFNVCMKIPLILCDIVVGYLIYWIIKDRTGDGKKAAYGFALWFLCPIVIYMSSVQAMFDTFSALLIMLTVIMFYKDKCFLGGMFFSMAVLLKFFPGFCVFVIFAYVIAKHRNDGLAKNRLMMSLAGTFVMTLVLMLPLMINGQVDDALSFITDRVGRGGTIATLFTFSNVLIAVLASLFFGYAMYRSKPEDADRSLLLYVFLSITASALISITPQYVIVMLPFLIIHILTVDKRYLKCWFIIGFSSFLSAFILNNYSLFTSLSGYTNIVTQDWVISGMQSLESVVIMGFTSVSFIVFFTSALQYLGVVLVLLFFFAESIEKRVPVLGNIITNIKNWRADKYET